MCLGTDRRSATHPNTVGTVSAVCWQVVFYVNWLQMFPSVKRQIGDVDQEIPPTAPQTSETLLAFYITV